MLDASGNVYISGLFSDTVDFDPGPGDHILSSAGGHDGFILKLDPAGNLIWVRQIGGSSNDYVRGLALDAAGNVFARGNTTRVRMNRSISNQALESPPLTVTIKPSCGS